MASEYGILMKHRLKNTLGSLRLYYRFFCRKLGIPDYEVHRIYLPEQDLLYIPIPKNASTTLKHALYEIEFGRRFDGKLKKNRGFEDHHDYYKKRPGAFTGVRALKSMKGVTRFALVRDPVERLVSCYRNRVLELEDLRSSAFLLGQLGLPVKPDINTFVLNLRRYRKANKLLEHHSRPQYRFLGGTTEYLDRVFPMEEITELYGMLKGYKPDLRLLNRKAGETDTALNDLSEKALHHAIKFYRRDYQLLDSFYSPDAVRKKLREVKS